MKKVINKIQEEKGITLIALVITIVVLIILAGVSMKLLLGENGLLSTAKYAVQKNNKASVEEKLQLMLSDYLVKREEQTITLEEYLNEQKQNGKLDEVTNNNDGTISVELEGYEITIKEEDLSIISIEKAGGVKPEFAIQITKTDGSPLETGETEKAITINITNISEYGTNYKIEIKDSKGNKIEKEENVVGTLTGQASFMITKSDTYTITVTGIKDEILRSKTRVETIKVAMPTISETEMFERENRVIDIVWLDTENKVITNPLSPKDYLGGLTAIKYEEENWVPADENNAENDWYHYDAQTGTNDAKTSNWANARTSDENVYLVWIPRYAYKITYFNSVDNANAYRENGSTVGIIGYSTIEGFIDVTSGRPKLVEGSEPTNVNVENPVKNENYADYIPHPAFEFDGAKAGIWVGKFENTGNSILPNANAYRTQKLSVFLNNSKNLKDNYNLEGDSHLMKNIEWGCVTYLSDSKYGRNGAKIEVSGSYTTAGGDYQANFLQSTTGNVYGIYDMSGTSWDYVAGVYSGNLSNSNYDFAQMDEKYYDSYVSYSESKSIKGDAIYECPSTYVSNDKIFHYAEFPNSTRPVFVRGRFCRR